ncbi:hypothetical protein NEOLI_001523 [Neolecta irregularis DAH-3]|uniref:Uncharacterized protein n=1 Tax=Neolecta irregularis (strain DAH-3) TaxID=1198029 RepID=A0A1U7LLK0_NEOID|nr:hypothetical protein NEOLI_001523 [Neolecta irregularis DAH-3]|eukprot:OLL23535.1 hypothetical protein NEOLI_001523 [Neolecta irregularis DAH-3]
MLVQFLFFPLAASLLELYELRYNDFITRDSENVEPLDVVYSRGLVLGLVQQHADFGDSVSAENCASACDTVSFSCEGFGLLKGSSLRTICILYALSEDLEVVVSKIKSKKASQTLVGKDPRDEIYLYW